VYNAIIITAVSRPVMKLVCGFGLCISIGCVMPVTDELVAEVSEQQLTANDNQADDSRAAGSDPSGYVEPPSGMPDAVDTVQQLDEDDASDTVMENDEQRSAAAAAEMEDHNYGSRSPRFVYISTDVVPCLIVITCCYSTCSQRLLHCCLLVNNGIMLTILCILLQTSSINLQCFDAVGWAAGRASGL